MLIHHLVIFGGHWSNASGDIKYLICHVTSQNFVIEGSFNFMSGSATIPMATKLGRMVAYVTTLPSLVAIGIVVAEICF